MRNRTGRGASETVTIAFEGALEREGEREKERDGGRESSSLGRGRGQPVAFCKLNFKY